MARALFCAELICGECNEHLMFHCMQSQPSILVLKTTPRRGNWGIRCFIELTKNAVKAFEERWLMNKKLRFACFINLVRELRATV